MTYDEQAIDDEIIIHARRTLSADEADAVEAMLDATLTPLSATELVDDEERTLGLTQGQWARENVGDLLDLRDGYPTTEDILTHGPEWVAGYIEGARS